MARYLIVTLMPQPDDALLCCVQDLVCLPGARLRRAHTTEAHILQLHAD